MFNSKTYKSLQVVFSICLSLPFLLGVDSLVAAGGATDRPFMSFINNNDVEEAITVPAEQSLTGTSLLQFTAGGHVIGFAPTQVILAALDHALRIEFVGTAGVTPVAAGAEVASFSDGPTMERAQPLGMVTYPEVWRGVNVEYRASAGSIVKSTYTLAPGADVAQIRLRYNVPVELQSDGSLQFPFGRGFIRESAPLAWQEIDGARVPVPVAFRVFETADVNLQSEI